MGGKGWYEVFTFFFPCFIPLCSELWEWGKCIMIKGVAVTFWVLWCLRNLKFNVYYVVRWKTYRSDETRSLEWILFFRASMDICFHKKTVEIGKQEPRDSWNGSILWMKYLSRVLMDYVLTKYAFVISYSQTIELKREDRRNLGLRNFTEILYI